MAPELIRTRPIHDFPDILWSVNYASDSFIRNSKGKIGKSLRVLRDLRLAYLHLIYHRLYRTPSTSYTRVLPRSVRPPSVSPEEQNRFRQSLLIFTTIVPVGFCPTREDPEGPVPASCLSYAQVKIHRTSGEIFRTIFSFYTSRLKINHSQRLYNTVSFHSQQICSALICQLL